MKKRILKLISEIEDLQTNKPISSEDDKKTLVDYASAKYNYNALKSKNYETQIKNKKELLTELLFDNINYKQNKNNHDQVLQLFTLTKDTTKNINKIKELLNLLNFNEEIKTKTLNLTAPVKTPIEIKDEINLDIKEFNCAFNSECYRASIILCGRILETCLHRIYFDATNNDLLEKSPGIGLGNLIAKIRDKGIDLDPGLTQQIHLINNVRIFSVHKKKQLFMPTKQQTYATILYTLDIIERMF